MILAPLAACAQDGAAWLGVMEDADPNMVTTWALTVDDVAGRTITLPLRTGFDYDFTVDWGDGSTGAVTAYDDADRIHEYTTTGAKTVKILGSMGAWYFNNGGDKLKFRTVESWGDVQFTGLGLVAAFYGCANATYFADLPYMAVTTLYQTWYGCSSLTTAPDVDTLVLVTSLAFTWGDCSSLTTAPDVDTLVLVTTLYRTWGGCSSLTTAPLLPTSSTALVNTTSALNGVGSGMGGTVVDLWNATNFPNVAAFTATFTGATGLTNYADIPDAWKGL